MAVMSEYTYRAQRNRQNRDIAKHVSQSTHTTSAYLDDALTRSTAGNIADIIAPALTKIKGVVSCQCAAYSMPLRSVLICPASLITLRSIRAEMIEAVGEETWKQRSEDNGSSRESE